MASNACQFPYSSYCQVGDGGGFRTGETTGEKMLRARSDSNCDAFYSVFVWCVCVCIDGGFEGVLAGGGEERMIERERERKKEKKGKEKEQTRHGGEND